MPSETTQAGRLLPVQDLWHLLTGLCHDRVRRLHGPVKTVDLRRFLPEEGETPRSLPV